MGSRSQNTDETLYVRFEQLEGFTNHFSSRLGAGPRGEVFKGTDSNKKDIAVKIPLRRPNGNPAKEFDWEFKSLQMLKHPNIIKLVAYCKDIEYSSYNPSTGSFGVTIHPGLCYDYAAKGSLGDYISDQGHPLLDWDTCYKIIVGTCEGLNYLHNNPSGSCIFHLDLKPKNILLTDSMVPKISGFGMFSMYNDKEDETSQTTLGTPRYSPPEYRKRREVYKEFDIYSLGGTIIEIIAGPQTYDKVNRCSHQDIFDHVRKMWTHKAKHCEQINACIGIALKCLNHDHRQRPEIRAIIDELNNMDPSMSSSRKSIQYNASGYEKFSGESTIPSSSNKLHSRYPVTEMDSQWHKLTEEFTTSLSTGGNQVIYNDDEAEETNYLEEANRDEEASDEMTVQTISTRFFPPVLSVDVHPMKQWVMTSHSGGQVCLWDYSKVEGKSLELMVNVSDKEVRVANFFDEELFVAGDVDGTIYVHNYRVDRQVKKFRAHDGCILSLAIQPGKRYVLSAASDGAKGRLQLWDRNNQWERSQILAKNQERVMHMAFNPLKPDDFVVAYADGVITFRSIQSNSKAVRLRVISRHLFYVDYINIGGLPFLITATKDGIAKIWDADTRACAGELEVVEGFISASCNPENPVLIASSKDGFVYRWDVSTDSKEKLQIGFEPHVVRYINRMRFVAGGENKIAIVESEMS